MRGHNICFPLEIRKIIFELSSIPPLIWSSAFSRVLRSIHTDEWPGLRTWTHWVAGLSPTAGKILSKSKLHFTAQIPSLTSSQYQIRGGIEDNLRIIFLISQ